MACQHCSGALSDRVFRVRRDVTLALYGATLLLSFFLTGDLLHDRIEGIKVGASSLWKIALPLVVLIVTVLAARYRTTRACCTKCDIAAHPNLLFVPLEHTKSDKFLAADPNRRDALRVLGTGGAVVAAGVGGAIAVVGRNAGWVSVGQAFFQPIDTLARQQRQEWADSKIRSYRRLGRTNAMVSDISVGSARIKNVDVARAAIDRGVTYFDTSPDYSDSESERVLGKAIKDQRDKIFLATKFCDAGGHLPNDTPVPKIIEAVEESLQRLQTDYVDLIHIHSCDRLDRLHAPNIHEAFDRLKEQGKARFLGVSSHTPNLEEVAHSAIDSGRFDVLMMAYHFGMWPNFGAILEKAKKHDVGVVAMKTLKGAKHTNLADFRKDADSYSQAAFRWVLSNPNVSCLVVSFWEPAHVDEYLYASGTVVQPSDVALLERYDQLTAGDYCQPHCGICLPACEKTLAVNDILRYRMYFKDYGWEKEGMRHYAQLERNASLCTDCPAPCTGTCPIGVPIKEKMMDAHDVLKFVA